MRRLKKRIIWKRMVGYFCVALFYFCVAFNSVLFPLAILALISAGVVFYSAQKDVGCLKEKQKRRSKCIQNMLAWNE